MPTRPREAHVACSLSHGDLGFEYMDLCVGFGVFTEIRKLERALGGGGGAEALGVRGWQNKPWMKQSAGG